MIIFDTDLSLGTPAAEIDDGAALIFLHHYLKEKVLAVTTVHGNADLDHVVHNTRRLLAYLEWELPVSRGAAQGLAEKKEWFADWQAAYGRTEPWPGDPVLPDAVSHMAELIRRHPRQVTIIAVGPLTNLAELVKRSPNLVRLVRQVIAMGASFGDETPQVEFNTRCDPEAAAIVFSAGWPLRLIGLHITRQIKFSRRDFAELPDHNPAIALLKKQAPGWIDRLETQGWGAGDCALHDAVAAAAYRQPELFTWLETGIEVALRPADGRGITTLVPVSPDHRPVEVAVAVDGPACRRQIWAALASAARPA